MKRARPSTVTFGGAVLGVVLACALGCQYATGLSGFDTREDGGGGATTQVSGSTDATGANTNTGATQDASATTAADASSTSGSTGAVVTTLADGLERPADIVLADGTLYFIELGPEGGLGRISSVSADGPGAADPLVSDRSGPSTLAVSGRRLYFADATPNRLWMIDLDDPTRTVVEIANGFFGTVRHVAVDATHVYFAASNGIRRMLLDGTMLETVSTDTTLLYWLDVGEAPGLAARSDGVFSFAKTAPSTLDSLFSVAKGVTSLARGGNNVFTIEFGKVVAHDLDGGEILVTSMDAARRIATHPSIPTRAIWTVNDALHTGTSAGNDVTTISGGFEELFGLAVAPGFAYVTDTDLDRVSRISLPTF